MKIYEERNGKSMFLKYTIYTDRIKVQGFPGFYSFNIRFNDIERVEIKRGPVFKDFPRSKRILKNDLADLFEHITIVKKTGFWREVRITPKAPKRFLNILRCNKNL
tara:strand:- start:252 stop:569 length:318 start_codon:yes stop_codon:yes gene_type:complete